MKYQDCSTIIITPTKGRLVDIKAVESWMNLKFPLNNKFKRVFVMDLEVGEAYSSIIESILENPELSKYKYILTIEADNLPPTDGLMKLLENMDKFDVIGGLYWSKGGEVPMVFGDTREEFNFRPFIETRDLVPCYGIGMGFTLFKMDIFKSMPIEMKPFFKTVQTDTEMMTQDLYFCKNINKLGYKVACDTRVQVGHIDENGKVW